MASKKVGLIIQARMGSKRLPGKSMMDLAGAPLVGRLIERVKRCQLINQIILAIPNTSENLVLAKLAEGYNINLFAGPEDDVLERYFQAAVKFSIDLICRIPADNPVPEPSEIDRIISYHLSQGVKGFSSNLAEIWGSGYPDGIGAEVFDFQLLADSRSSFFNASKREHVHLNFFDYTSGLPVNTAWCPIQTIQCPVEFRRPDLILDVNTIEQYIFMSNLYKSLYPINPNFHIRDIINWYDSGNFFNKLEQK